MYVASKVSEVYENEFEQQARDLAQELIEECEGPGTVPQTIPPADYGEIYTRHDVWVIDPHKPVLSFVKRRRVKNAHVPDSFVRDSVEVHYPGDASGPDVRLVETEYSAVVDWIPAARRATYEAVIRGWECESVRAVLWMLGNSLFLGQTASVLRERPDWVELLRAASQDELAEFFPEPYQQDWLGKLLAH